MNKTICLVTGMVLASNVATGYAADSQSTFQPSITVISDDTVYNVNADGTYTRDDTESYRINTQDAVSDLAQLPLRYSPALEDLTVVEAYTTTADGQRIDVTPDRILDRASQVGAEAPTFDDNRVKTIVFPKVEVGAILTVHERRVQHTPTFPGQFSALEVFGDEKAINLAKLTVRAPSSVKLYADAEGMSSGEEHVDPSGAQVWKWTLSNVPGHRREIGAVSSIDHSPRVALTTFPDFSAVADAYRLRADPKAAVRPAIQQMADQITQGVDDPKAQAEAIYNWVSKNIRYVAVYFGFGTVVPHDAVDILNARYGDCKDHVTLLEALLAAKHIRSSTVLINAGSVYWLPKVATPLGIFNHVITYLPDQHLFVDSTSGLARFGDLSPTELGKMALVTDNGTGKAEMVQIPVSSPQSLQDAIATQVSLNDNGDVTGTNSFSRMGPLDMATRALMAGLPPNVEAETSALILSATGQSGTGDFRHSDVHDLNLPLTLTTSFNLPNYAQFPGPGAMSVPLGLEALGGLSPIFDAFAPATRDFAMPLPGRKITETTVIKWPSDIKIDTLPKPITLTSALASYTSNYLAKDNTITVTRELTISVPDGVIKPDQYAELRPLIQAVKRDVRSQITY